MGDGLCGGGEVAEPYALVGRRPFLVDANVAGAVLHDGDSEHFLDDVAVTDISEPGVCSDLGCFPDASV